MELYSVRVPLSKPEAVLPLTISVTRVKRNPLTVFDHHYTRVHNGLLLVHEVGLGPTRLPNGV